MTTERSTIAERAEDSRDLRNQLGGLKQEEEREIIFKETSPRRRKVMIWSMIDGEPLSIPSYQLENALRKVQADGSSMFTGYKNRAPEYVQGNTKCFMHANSPEREVLNSIGLAGALCPADHLANVHEKRVHAKNRHQREWAAYQEHEKDRKEQEAIDRQEKTMAAMLGMAQSATQPVSEEFKCEDCGKTAKTAFGLQSHMRSHKE